MSRGHILVFFNRHCSTMNLVKEKQGGLVPTGLKRWPIKLIKNFVDATGVSPSPAGPAGCCPLNFLNLINLKFRVTLFDLQQQHYFHFSICRVKASSGHYDVSPFRFRYLYTLLFYILFGNKTFRPQDVSPLVVSPLFSTLVVSPPIP